MVDRKGVSVWGSAREIRWHRQFGHESQIPPARGRGHRSAAKGGVIAFGFSEYAMRFIARPWYRQSTAVSETITNRSGSAGGVRVGIVSPPLSTRACCGWSFGQYVFTVVPERSGGHLGCRRGRHLAARTRRAKAERAFPNHELFPPGRMPGSTAGRMPAATVNTYFGHSRGPVAVSRCARARAVSI